MRLTLDPLRISLLAALGLVACGPVDNTTGSETSQTGGADTGTTAGTAATTTDPTGSTSNPTTGATATSDGSGSATDGTGPGTSTATDDGGETSTTGETGETGDTGDTGAQACDTLVMPADQEFTDPPVPSGFEKCNDGILHRADKVACEVPITPSTCPGDALAGCKTDADCVEKPFGSCQLDMVFGGFTEGTCSCNYGCQTDADCGAGEICRCGGDGLGLYTQCIPAGCTQDSDCPDGEICGLSPDTCAPGGFLTACTTPDDLCPDVNTCGSSTCIFVDAHWECNNVACGRPFVIDAQAVVAPAVAREDWRAVQLAPTMVETSLAATLAAHWTRIGQLEHASVAAFAQFALQLLAVGAPPTLVLAAQQALADELEHARLAFGLASLYAGTGVGPGPLVIAGLDAGVDLATLVDAVIREACLGETLAAFEAREAAAQAEDPGVRAALREIAEDEARHAELGWRFVQWALADAGADAWARARATFAAAVAEARLGVARDALDVGTPELRAHGVVDAPLRAQIWACGLRDVIEPCAAALLERRAA